MRDWLASACLLIGGFIYISLRSDFLLLDCLFQTVLWPLVNSLRITVDSPNNVLINALVFSIPDALWCAAFVLFVRGIWEDTSAQVYLTIVGLTICMCFAQELLQLPAILPGTFDPMDLVWIGIGVLGSTIAFASQKEKAHWRMIYDRLTDLTRLKHRSTFHKRSSAI